MTAELRAIQERNRRVEADKAWETSWTRRLIIAVLTYILAGLFLLGIAAPRPWLNAFVPTLGFILSTATLQVLKKRWLQDHQLY